MRFGHDASGIAPPVTYGSSPSKGAPVGLGRRRGERPNKGPDCATRAAACAHGHSMALPCKRAVSVVGRRSSGGTAVDYGVLHWLGRDYGSSPLRRAAPATPGDELCVRSQLQTDHAATIDAPASVGGAPTTGSPARRRQRGIQRRARPMFGPHLLSARRPRDPSIGRGAREEELSPRLVAGDDDHGSACLAECRRRMPPRRGEGSPFADATETVDTDAIDELAGWLGRDVERWASRPNS